MWKLAFAGFIVITIGWLMIASAIIVESQKRKIWLGNPEDAYIHHDTLRIIPNTPTTK